MSSDQHLQLGKKQNVTLNLNQIKSGVSSAEFKDNQAMLSIFNSCDTNKNSVLDENEVTVFKDKLTQAAGEDSILNESEARKLIKQEQAVQNANRKQQGQSADKTKVKAKDLYDFANTLQTWSRTTNIKSSVAEGDKRVVTYEDGAQEVINKDGSKILTTISGGIKTVQTRNAEGKLEKEEITNEEEGTIETILYDEKGVSSRREIKNTKENSLETITYTEGKPVSYVKQKDGSLEQIEFAEDGQTIKSHTIKTADATFEIGTEGFANGKVTREINGEGDEQQIIDYNYTGENDFTKTLKYKDTETVSVVKDGKIESLDSTQYDAGHNKVQSVHIAENGTKTVSLYKNNKVVYDAITSPKGTLTETQYNESGHKLMQQITTKDGKISVAEYDGHGNTKVVVQNGETIPSLGQKFRRTTAQITSLNRNLVHRDSNNAPYFLVGEEVRISGEYPANYKGLQHRNGAAVEIAEYTAQEEQRVAQRLQGKPQKAITLQKNYQNWYNFAKEQLKSEGVANPTKGQINDRTNELLLLNPNVEIPKKGSRIVAIKTDAEVQVEKRREEQKHARAVQGGVVEGMRADYNRAVSSFNNQMKKDGWAADVADAVSYIWNNDLWSATGNTARQVRQDLSKYHEQLSGLRTAYRSGDAQFKAKFKETFGVEYNQKNVEVYNAKKQKLASVSTAVATEKAVTTKMDKLFKEGNASAIQKGLQGILGLSNADMAKLKEKLKKEGKSLDVNYMRSVYADVKKGLALNTKKALNGKTLQQYQNEMNASYKRAFGTRNDIVERVENYNASQDTGAAVVKTTTKIVGSAIIAVASGGSASGLLIAAVGSSALSFTVDATDMMSDGRVHSGDEYLTAGKNAAIDGTGQLISGGMSKGLKLAEVGRVTRYTVQAATDLSVDLTAEYLQTGEVNLSTAITSIVSSVGGEVLGDFLEARRARKLEASTDPLYREQKGWANMTPEERSANLQARTRESAEFRAENPRPLSSADQVWAGGAQAVETINPEHSRYSYTITSSQMGLKPDTSAGIHVAPDVPSDIRVDITSSQRRAIQADVASLGVASGEFSSGLEALEAVQTARTSYTQRADGVVDYAATKGMGQKSSGVSTRSAVTAPGREEWRAGSGMREDVYHTLAQKGLIGDSQLVEDCGNLAGKAYGTDKAYNGWNILTDANGKSMTVDLDNGFHAKAYEKDGKIVVAFRGSDDVGDLTSDFAMLAGRTPEQLDNAIAFVDKIKQQYPDANVIVTGHSLGGSLTEMVASKYDDVVGFTFDAVGTKGIVEATGGKLVDNHNTVNYIVHGDVLSNADAHVGQTVVVNNITKNNELLSPHAIGNFMGNSSALEGVEGGILARHVAVNTDPNAVRLANLVAQSADGSVTLDKKQFRGIAERFEYDVNTMGADLNALEQQVKALSDPQQRQQLQNMIDSRRVAITSGTDIKANTNVLRSLSGDEVNDVLKKEFGFSEPGFLGGDTPSAELVTRKETKFVRVYNDESSFARGTWLMPYDEVVGKTPAEIKDFYALPAMPKYIVEVDVPAGTKMFTGKCNPLEGWGNGGGTQYFITDNFEIPTRFDKKRLIPDK